MRRTIGSKKLVRSFLNMAAAAHGGPVRASAGDVRSRPVSPVTGELRRLVEQPTAAGKLGLPPHATVDQVRSEASEKRSWAHTQAPSTMIAAEDATLVVLIRTYGMLAA
ncbi:hypothetical protein [Rhodococcus sp. Q]|uniref:hypothetical protein n=1 Tax=Rhodococcus sp. Q TaxID=2502252 RepID=UPI0010F7DB88|nr:hypothetical protein [Rhodococcus sp. Q]